MNKEPMTCKERILCAMRGGQPDRVPVQLGIMTIAPRYANDSGWDMYYHGKHNLHEMMTKMVDEFGFDGYLYSGVGGKPEPRDRRKWSRDVVRQDADLIVVRDTEPMLTGTPDDVEKDVIRCLEAAKAGGGYILFTEEGLGRNTPFENIRKYIEVGKREGKY